MEIAFVPGRTELAGNHTDHQGGRALASAIDMGLYARFEKKEGTMCTIRSQGFPVFDVRTDHTVPKTSQFGTSKAMARGVISVFRELGLNVGAFEAVISSTLPSGIGLSSSAAFGVMIGRILSKLYNNDSVNATVLARAAQQAENVYFGKPCGLMSQLACALGKTVYADFTTGETEILDPDFSSMGLTMCLTDTGGSHAGLATSYARIPADMTYIANIFDKGQLGDVSPDAFRSRGWDPSNRPVRRAMHFFDENDRVPLMRDALKRGDGQAYMDLMNESGRSSEKLLNNIVTSTTGDTKLLQGLELSEHLLKGIGAWRVHGGGFAGAVQALMPFDLFPYYKTEMERSFGEGSCHKVKLL